MRCPGEAGWSIVLWLAVINMAFANLLLGERVTLSQVVRMVVAILSVAAVVRWGKRRSDITEAVEG